jgi:type IV pilus assembly protein PilQ
MGDVVMSRLSAGWQRLIAAAVLILAAAIGCRSSQPARVVEARPAPEQAPAASQAAPVADGRAQAASASATEIRTLELREGAPEVFVDLEASAPLVWTSYRNPEGKVVVELPNAVPSPRVQDISPEDGLVSSVKVQRESEGSRPMTRLVIATRHEVEHSVTADGLHLQIRLLPLETQARIVAKESAKPKLAFEPVPQTSPAPQTPQPSPAPQPSTPAAPAEPVPAPVSRTQAAPAPSSPVSPAMPATPATAGAGTPDAPAVAPAPSGSPASRLETIEVLPADGGGTVIRISGDGEFPYSTFALSEPSRFVVDLQGVVNRSPRSTVAVHGSVVQQVRVAQFRPGPKGVARVVFDLKQNVVPRIERSGQALLVSFPEAPSAQSGAGAAAQPQPSPSPSSQTSQTSASAAAPSPSASAAASPAPAPRRGKGTRAAAPSATSPATDNAPAAPAASAPPADTRAASPQPPARAAAAPSQAPAPAAPPSDLSLRTPPAPAAGAPVQVAAARRPAGIEVEDAPPVPAGKSKGGSAASLPHVTPGANSLQQPPADLGRKAGSTTGEKLGQDVSGEQKAYTGEPIDLKVTNADVTEVLRTFAQISGLNIVVQPGVNGTVTAELENVPWDQAFEEVLKINNLGYEREGNVIRIAPNDVLKREAQDRQQLAQARALVIPLRTVMRRLSYAKAQEVANLLRNGTSGLLTQRGSVIVDERTNTLIIKELPDFLDAVLAVVSNLDTPEPQVMIEARIIETTKDFSRSLGIQWGFNAVADAAHGNTTGLIFPNNATAGPQGGTSAPGNVNLLTGAQNGSLKIDLGNVLNTFTLDLQLQAAEHEGLLNILSAPKVATLNNQQAYIQSGIQLPIQTIANNTVTTQFINATLRLEVTPQVTAEGTIIMDINISKKEPVTSLIIAGATNAPISTKDAKTRLVVRDGGTAVIGGIYKVTSNVSEDRVPGLANLPIVGHLFKNKSRDEQNDELLIFITPRVIKI